MKVYLVTAQYGINWCAYEIIAIYASKKKAKSKIKELNATAEERTSYFLQKDTIESYIEYALEIPVDLSKDAK